MAMEFLPFDNQFVTGLAPHRNDDYLILLDIIQGPEVSCAKLKLGEGVRAQAFDCFRGRGGLVL
jgi:hypothetical protein